MQTLRDCGEGFTLLFLVAVANPGILWEPWSTGHCKSVKVSQCSFLPILLASGLCWATLSPIRDSGGHSLKVENTASTPRRTEDRGGALWVPTGVLGR